MGIITGPNWRPRLPDSLVVEGALAPPCPTLPQLPGTQFLQPLGVGTLLSWVLEPPPSPGAVGSRSLYARAGGGGGEGRGWEVSP